MTFLCFALLWYSLGITIELTICVINTVLVVKRILLKSLSSSQGFISITYLVESCVNSNWGQSVNQTIYLYTRSID